jgi:hypothetical protein
VAVHCAERIDLSRLLSKIPNYFSISGIYGGTGSNDTTCLSLHAEIFRDAMRDVFGIFFVAFWLHRYAISPLFLC